MNNLSNDNTRSYNINKLSHVQIRIKFIPAAIRLEKQTDIHHNKKDKVLTSEGSKMNIMNMEEPPKTRINHYSAGNKQKNEAKNIRTKSEKINHNEKSLIAALQSDAKKHEKEKTANLKVLSSHIKVNMLGKKHNQSKPKKEIKM